MINFNWVADIVAEVAVTISVVSVAAIASASFLLYTGKITIQDIKSLREKKKKGGF